MDGWRRWVLAATICVLGAAGANAKFKQGDRVALIGDSITHDGRYHSNVYLYYATRFPNAPFKVYNRGISGDTAPGTNGRFAWDIAPLKPNVATIMLGMNDAWAWCFEPEGDAAAMEAGRKNCRGTYVREMNRLIESLKAINCRIILIKPSIYDQTAEGGAKNLVGKNDMLARFGEYLEELTAKHGAELVNFQTPMLAVNKKLQAKDPAATVVGVDRVHPGDAGHFVMAYAFLRDQDSPRYVSSIELDAAAGKQIKLRRCSLEKGAVIQTNRVAFTCLEKALPYPVVGEQRVALDWVPFQQKLNRQMLKVANLNPGTYDLAIDGTVVGAWSSERLAAGVNLSDHDKTPQHRQAMEVKAVNDQRLVVGEKLRAIAHVRHSMIHPLDPPVDEADRAALKAALEARLEESKGEPWYGYLKTQVEQYLEHAPREAEYRAEAEKLMEKMWTINKPRAHEWTLTAK